MVFFLWKNPDIPKEVNFKLDLPNTKRLELDMLLKCANDEKKGMIGITESVDLLDNRRSMSNLSKFMDRVTNQSRKIGKDLLIDSIILDTIDWRFIKKMDLRITAWGENLTDKLNKGFYYECIARIRQIYTVNGRIKAMFIWSEPQIRCIPYEVFNQFKDLYDTYEISETDESENLSVAVMSDKKKREIVDSLSKMIMNDRDKFGIDTNKKHISHGEVLSILLDLSKPTGLEYELHAKLNRLIQIEKQQLGVSG
jgi:hypothetical protein